MTEHVLHIHRAERSDRLADALAEVISTPLPDPFTPEVVAVPAKGVERWLNQRLSQRQGVSANLRFPSPARLVAESLQTVTDRSQNDPWQPKRLLWAVLETMDVCVGEPWCAILSNHLGTGSTDHRSGRRWTTANLLTTLFTSYGNERPRMLTDWLADRDTDGAGASLRDHQRWQAELWRRVRARIGEPSPAERLADSTSALRDRPADLDLPQRISLFGPTRMTTEQLSVLGALAEHRDVHLWLPHPSPNLWTWLGSLEPSVRRRDDLSARAVNHPLLASLARDTRELQQRLRPLGGTDTHHDRPEQPPSLLTTVQRAIRDDAPPGRRTAANDGSIQVHACHGPARQVEVLRDALLHSFEGTHSLEPRDVICMCTDVETYAPLIRAAFGQGEAAGPSGHPGHRLRVRLADRSLRQTNALLDIVTTLLGLAGDRVTASQVIDFAAIAAVRQRFEFDDDELEQLRSWTARAGIRWGISAQQRRFFGLGDIQQGTWVTGLDRVLLGVAADESDLGFLDRTLPLDDVDSTSVDLAGRVSELVDRLWSVLASLQGPQPVAEWVARLGRGLTLLTDVPDADSWQLAQALGELGEAVESAGPAPLLLADVRAMLADLLAGRPTRANFRTGELTVCTMVPMRSVPHRIVALLGLDDDVFPRGAGVDGDDVLAVDPCVGERDRRSEDRQLLLDAVMSAEDQLIILYSGADPVSGQPRPPAVPLGELLDVVEVTCGEDIVRRHPLQPFAPRNVDAQAPFSFDPAALRGARAAVSPERSVPVLLPASLPAAPAGDVMLDELIGFASNPVQGFLRQRLGVAVPDPEEDDDVRDELDTSLDGLAKWHIGERMLEARLRGVEPGAFRDAEWRRGTLPPFRLGRAVLDEIEPQVEALAQACLPVHVGPATTIDVDLVIDPTSGRRLIGTVSGIYGSVLASSSYSRLAAKHRMAAWIRLLAVAAHLPGEEWRALTTGRGRPIARSELTAPVDPLTVLRELVSLRDLGLREPLPAGPTASAAYAEARHREQQPGNARALAAKQWSDTYGDRNDRHIVYVHGPSPSFEVVEAAAPVPGETAWSEPSRFGNVARQLWAPLLTREQLGRA
jgi:exodeoxyribonuclease V gamma subunit